MKRQGYHQPCLFYLVGGHMKKVKICVLILMILLFVPILLGLYKLIFDHSSDENLFHVAMIIKGLVYEIILLLVYGGLLSNNNQKPKIYITGSVSQEDEIRSYAEKMMRKYGRKNVKYVKKQLGVQFSVLIHRCYENIDWATIVYVCRKHDGTIGTGTTYEVEYAKHLKKTVIFLDPDTSCCIENSVNIQSECPNCGNIVKEPYHVTFRIGFDQWVLSNHKDINDLIHRKIIYAIPTYSCNECGFIWDRDAVQVRDKHGNDINTEFSQFHNK